jgi:hypothetical protein
MDDDERSAVIGTVIGFLLGVILCMGGQITYMEVTEAPEPTPKVTIERWDDDQCIVLIHNGEEVAPAEPPLYCSRAVDKYPQAHYREL